MSVKRYTNGADDDQGTILPFMEESPNGDYVEYSDYAALLAEVERLRKAGDAMLPFIIQPPHAKGSHSVILAWISAKEGKQS